MAVPDSVLDKIPHLPESPGVYLWRDRDGTVLYVGKAKRLRSRVRSYVTNDHLESVKTRALMQSVGGLETIVVPSEAHALILEANLIKEYHPKYNIALRDDKSYPYIKVTIAEPFPRVWVTRHLVDDGSRYFGPYTDVGAMRRALNVVKRIFTVRSCNYDMPRQMPERPCLDYFIKRCKAPCILAQTQGEYRAMIDEVLVFLDGNVREVVRRVRERMALAAESLDFERAAELRDALRHLEQMEEPAVVMTIEGGDRDVVGYARDGDDGVIALMRIRGGRLLAREHQFVENLVEETDADVLQAYLVGKYLPLEDRSGEVLVPFDPAERELVETSLESMHCLAGIARIRGVYRSLGPDATRHFSAERGRWPEANPPATRLGSMLAFFGTTASMIAVINNVVAGAGVALLVHELAPSASRSLYAAAGVIAAAVLTGAFYAYQRWRFADFDASEPHDD